MITNGTPPVGDLLERSTPDNETGAPSARMLADRKQTLASADPSDELYADAFEMLGKMLDARGLDIQQDEVEDSVAAARRYSFNDVKRMRGRLLASRADLLLDGFDSEERRPGAGGRPATINRLALLTGLCMLALDNRPLWMRQLGSFFKNQIDDDARELLGLPDPNSKPSLQSKRNWEQNCRNAFQRMLGLMDPYPYSRYENRPYSEHAQERAEHEAHHLEREKKMYERLGDFADLLVNMTFHMQPRRLRRASAREKVNVSFDQTFMSSPLSRTVTASRLPAKIQEQRALEAAGRPKAGIVDSWSGYYVRETEDRQDGAPGTAPAYGSGRPTTKVGWQASIAMRVDDGIGLGRHPKLILATALSMPNVGVAETAADLLIRIADNGHRPGLAAADKEYWANAIPSRLQIPATARGWLPSTDYRIDRLGKWGDGHRGAIFVEGKAMCPATPKSIIDATKDRMQGRIDDVTYHKRRGNRRYFELRPKAKPDARGNVNMMCPAAGKSPTVICPLREMLKTASNSKDRWEIEDDDPNLPDRALMDDICKQHSVQFTPEDMPPAFQGLAYRSPEWHDFHSHARNSIESLNGSLKGTHHGNLDDHDRRRVRGFAAAYVFLVIMVVAFNMRRIADFLEAEAEESRRENPQAPPVQRARDRKYANPYTATLPGGAPDEVELARRREKKAEGARRKAELRATSRTPLRT
ncbi:hypothetical protein DEJ33_12910 [Curtobacterium sp. MCPF17_047]|uniref:hypothetical protein n=1 Tax=unclassified Curtobacterium TaxID=257496 RepID=UPI000DA7A73E|nr:MULTISPECIES: hypothetical protein [unclassified Curtobacterium]PZE56959.1 hypothetical protein DEJ24_12550 [Curtobacterium sp. MCPF17_001]PZF64011.1 hypothetical protein DEJ33_12910 [Curtobacterium sp. MCPF17_047]